MKRLFICLFLSHNYFPAFGQQPEFGQKSDSVKADRSTQYGFWLGANQTTGKTRRTGFSFGASVDGQLGERIFAQGQIVLSYIQFSSSTNNQSRLVETTLLSVPIHCLYKPFNLKTNPTLAFGISPTTDLSTNPNKLYFLPQSFFWPIDLGLSFERHLKYFVIGPEIRYSYHQTASFLFLILNFKV